MIQYVLGGYFLVKGIADFCSKKPPKNEKVYTVSNCVCDIFPDAWALSWVTHKEEDTARAKEVFDLTNADIDRLSDLADSLFDNDLLGWQYVLSNLETAQELYRQYLRNVDNIKLLAIGLPVNHIDEFLAAIQPSDNQGRTGILINVSKRIELEGGTLLGYDVLGYDPTGYFHTHLCHGIEYDLCSKYGILTNANGFIGSLEDAEKLSDILAQPENGAEPAYWLPWIVVEYPLG